MKSPAERRPRPTRMNCLGCILAGAVAAAIALVSGGCAESLPEVAAVEEPEAAPTRPVAMPAQVAREEPPQQEPEKAPAPANRPPKNDPPIVPTSVSSRLPKPRSASGVKEVTFDTIKFDMDKEATFERSMIPETIEKMTGERIRIMGYMLPSSVFQQTGIRQFILVRDNQQCCFGPGAALYDCIVVKMLPGRTAEFSVRPMAVEGTFKIEELRLNGRTMAIYHLDGESAK